MREFLPILQKWLDEGQRFAVATVIKTWGSAPRPPGSLMAVSQSGEMCGSVSGGCVETAVVEQAREVIASGTPRRLHYGVTNEEAWAVGLACGGSLDIFVEPWIADNAVKKALLQIWATRQSALLITRLSEPAGAQVLLTEESKQIGSVDNAEIDRQVAELARPDQFSRRAHTTTIDGTELLVRPFLPPPRLLLVGGVHIAQPLVRFAKALDFEVILIDPRTAFGNRQRFPDVDQLINSWPDEAIEQIGVDQNTFIVLLSHDAKIDDPAIITALRRQPAYIGVLGSRRTQEKRSQRLREAGLSAEQIASIHAPIGLKIGARSPAQIAASIVAEIISVQQDSYVV